MNRRELLTGILFAPVLAAIGSVKKPQDDYGLPMIGTYNDTVLFKPNNVYYWSEERFDFSENAWIEYIRKDPIIKPVTIYDKEYYFVWK